MRLEAVLGERFSEEPGEGLIPTSTEGYVDERTAIDLLEALQDQIRASDSPDDRCAALFQLLCKALEFLEFDVYGAIDEQLELECPRVEQIRLQQQSIYLALVGELEAARKITERLRRSDRAAGYALDASALQEYYERGRALGLG
jgi:hypothetical protein